MAVIGAENPTILDIKNAMDPAGAVAKTIELLMQTNELLTDMTFIEGNLPTGNQTSIRTGLPVVVWRKLYQGVPPSKSTRATVTDSTGMLEARAEVDTDALRMANSPEAFRMSENLAFLESMNQEAQRAIFYETTSTNPERITGLAPRYSSLAAGNGGNIIDAGGAGLDNTSVWLVVWGENTVHGITPKNQPSGLTHRDLGEQDSFDPDGNRFRAMHDLWQWKLGLTLKDWRYVVRIANIDVSDLRAGSGTQLNTAATWLLNLMVEAIDTIPAMGMGRPVFYANRTVKSGLSKLALSRSVNVLDFTRGITELGSKTPGGLTRDLLFQGIPVRTVDQLLNSESRVT